MDATGVVVNEDKVAEGSAGGERCEAAARLGAHCVDGTMHEGEGGQVEKGGEVETRGTGVTADGDALEGGEGVPMRATKSGTDSPESSSDFRWKVIRGSLTSPVSLRTRCSRLTWVSRRALTAWPCSLTSCRLSVRRDAPLVHSTAAKAVVSPYHGWQTSTAVRRGHSRVTAPKSTVVRSTASIHS